MLRRIPTRLLAVGFALTGVLLTSACAQKHLEGFDAKAIAVPRSTALGGTGLLQRKMEMQRAVNDMAAFHRTMEGMIERQDRASVGIFAQFMSVYTNDHLRPLLDTDWQSSHAELADLDINLRVLEIAMLIQMRQPKQVRWVLDELGKRYAGRDSLLVGYPIGQQTPLGEVRAQLEARMGSCMENKSKWGPAAQKRAGGGESAAEPICIGAL